MKSLWITIILFFLILLFGGCKKESKDILSRKERAWLNKQEKIEVVPDLTFAPVDFLDKDSIQKGITADVLSMIEKNINYKFSLRYVPSWNEMYMAVKNNESQIIPNIQSTPERRKSFLFTTPYVTLPNVIIINRKTTDIISVEDLANKRVAVVSGYATIDFLKERVPQIKIIEVPGNIVSLKMVSFDEVDAAIGNLGLASYYIDNIKLTNLKVVGDIHFDWNLCFGTSKQNDTLHSILQKGLNAVSKDELESVYRKWIQLDTDALNQYKDFWYSMIIIIIVLVILTIIVLYWNYSLKRIVRQKTKDLIKSNKELKESDRRFSLLTRNVASAMLYQILVKPDGEKQFIFVSPNVKTMFGLDHEEILKDPLVIYNCIIKEDQPALLNKEQVALASLSKFEFETRMVINKGESRWVKIVSTPRKYNNGDVVWDGVVIDITEQKQVENLLNNRNKEYEALNEELTQTIEELEFSKEQEIQNEQKYRFWFEQFPHQIFIWQKRDDDFVMVQANKKAYDDSNGKIANVFGIPSKIFWDDEPDLVEHLFKCYNSHETINIERKYQFRGSGKKMHTSTTLSFLPPDSVQILVLDISDKEKAKQDLIEYQKNLQNNIQLLNATQELTNTGGWIFSLERNSMYWTDEVYRIHGLTAIEVNNEKNNYIEKSISCYEKDKQDEIQTLFNRCVEFGEQYEGTYSFTDFTGKHKWVLTGGKPIYENGRIVSVMGYIVDVTDKVTREKGLKQAKERAEESEAKFKSYIDFAPSGIFLINEKGEYLEVNRAACEMTGYSEKELLKMSISNFMLPEQRSEGLAHFQKVKSEGFASGEFKFLSKNGKEKYWSIEAVRLSDVRFLAFTKDITGQKLAEMELLESRERLKESEIRFKALHNASFGGIGIHDKGIILDCNLGLSLMTGYSQEELIGMNGLLLIAEEDRETVMTNIVNKYQKPYEVNGLKKNGKIYPIRIEAREIPYKGKDVRVVEFRDITDRKKIEQEIIKHNEALLKAKEIAEENERFIQSIADQSPDIIYIHDIENQKNTYINKNLREILGYKPGEAPEDSTDLINLLMHPDDKDKFFSHDQIQTWEAEYVYHYEYRLKDSTGNWRWFEGREKEFHRKDGRVISLIGIVADVSEIKQTEKQLLLAKEKAEISEDRFRKMIDNMPNGVAIYIPVNDGEDFRFVDLNKEAEEITNATKQELIGHTLLEKFPNMKNGPLLKSLQKINREGQSIYIPPFYYKDSRREGWRENHIYKLKSGEIVAIFKDVTELKEAGERLKKQNVELLMAKTKAEESDRLKSEFINNMSHEIRTPMNGILGFSQFLSKEDVSLEKRMHYISIIQNSGQQLLRIIDDILEISKLGTKQVGAIEKEICLNDLLLQQFLIFEIKAKENQTPLYLKKGLKDEESMIYTDESKLQKILNNLLENAIKFTNVGFIELGYVLVDNNLSIYVKDTGIGIHSDKQEMIFERFSQEEKDVSKIVGGLGLGLSIAKENAELLGGSIKLQSEKGKGSVFTVTIPYKPVKTSKDYKKHQDLPLINGQNCTILVAEDDEVNFLYLETLLENEMPFNCKIIHAKNGKEAVEICQQINNIEFVLMDIKMPVMNGHDAARKINQIRPDLPIIAQTAYSTEADKEKALASGCVGFITKPIEKEKLKQMLEKFISSV